MVSPKIYVGSRRVAPATLSASPPPPSRFALVTWTLCFKTGSGTAAQELAAGKARREQDRRAKKGGEKEVVEEEDCWAKRRRKNNIHQTFPAFGTSNALLSAS